MLAIAGPKRNEIQDDIFVPLESAIDPYSFIEVVSEMSDGLISVVRGGHELKPKYYS